MGIHTATGGVNQMLTRQYPASEVLSLHGQFLGLKKYTEKLAFYDRHFNIIPFDFPPFSSGLPIFYEEKTTAFLIEIFKEERNNPLIYETQFLIENKVYRFDIRPTNSNNPVYNQFIIQKFLSRDPAPGKEVSFLPELPDATGIKILLEREKANNLINSIEYRLQYLFDKSFLHHFMTVFYKGLLDASTGNIRPSAKKGKLIVLYLYSQGILFARYMEALKKEQS